MTRCWLIRSFTGFDIGFTAFAVLFLEVWRLFSVNFKYHCQDSGENIHSWAYETVLRHLLSYL